MDILGMGKGSVGEDVAYKFWFSLFNVKKKVEPPLKVHKKSYKTSYSYNWFKEYYNILLNKTWHK